MNIVILSWVRVEKYCEMSGEPLDAVHTRIRSGEWAAGKHYKRTSQRVLWINCTAVEQWIDQQPHVEAACPPALKQARKKRSVAFEVNISDPP